MDGSWGKRLALVMCFFSHASAAPSDEPAVESPAGVASHHAYLAKSAAVRLKETPDDSARSIEVSLAGIWLHPETP